MSNAVVIKGTTYGFSVYVDEQAEHIAPSIIIVRYFFI